MRRCYSISELLVRKSCIWEKDIEICCRCWYWDNRYWFGTCCLMFRVCFGLYSMPFYLKRIVSLIIWFNFLVMIFDFICFVNGDKVVSKFKINNNCLINEDYLLIKDYLNIIFFYFNVKIIFCLFLVSQIVLRFFCFFSLFTYFIALFS